MTVTKFTFLTIFCIFFISTLAFLYFSKERFKNNENDIYKSLLISNLFGLILQTLCSVASYHYNMWPEILCNTIFKLYLIYFIIFAFLVFQYTILISLEKKNIYEKWKKSLNIIMVILCLPIIFLPINLYSDVVQEVFYTNGLAVTYVYAMSAILSTLMFSSLLIRNKNVKQKKATPLYFFLFACFIGMIIQRSYPEAIITCYIESFVCFIMYFTIENPDVKMLNELYKNKELMEQNYEDKYNFLFEMTQEARNPLVNINSLSTALRNEDDPVKVKEGLMTLNNMVRQLDFSINNILNISSLDVQKLKIINSTYELDKLCNEIATRIKPELHEGVNFELSMPKQVPTLYGDYMKLRQIIYSLLVNSCKNTENGNIYLKVNVIEKYDICRVVFNISDTGRGMPIEQINEIISATGELEKSELENLEKREFNVKVCQKVMKIMGGNLMIKSNIGEGTDVILTIDQRVHHEKENSILTAYENDIANYRKVLIVCQDKNIINAVKRKLNANNITSSVLYYGMDAVDKIKSGKKYDFILVEDEMKEMTGFMTFKEMQKVKDFKIPTIVMLKKDKDNIKEHFIEDGFKDYLLVDMIDSELDRIIERF